jgi:predicted nucleotidyltransferase component of viral defense system
MKDLVQQRMDRYSRVSMEDEENALKEVAQEIVLYALYKADFFTRAAFLGGTALRILHGLDRFSEDLDFSLFKTDQAFDLVHYLAKTAKIMAPFGFNIEVDARDGENRAVQQGMLKDDSIKQVITFKHQHNPRKKIKIKVEVDTTPPPGITTEQRYVDFPIDFVVVAGDLASLFAGKCHALLCRNYVKGRDWYDFSWFLARGIQPNYDLLTNALHQAGPWRDQEFGVDRAWLQQQLAAKIDLIDWVTTRNDVARFVGPQRQESLNLWSHAFFHSKLARLM